MVLSVNEVPDGSADSMIDDIFQELQELREMAHLLRLPNAELHLSLSDSVSTHNLCKGKEKVWCYVPVSN